MTETLRYLFIALLLGLASQGIAQNQPAASSADEVSPNTEIQAFTTEVNAIFDGEILLDGHNTETNSIVESATTLPELTGEELLDQVTYFKVKKIAHKTKFAEESLFRKSYIA